jgi:hypothetical protein
MVAPRSAAGSTLPVAGWRSERYISCRDGGEIDLCADALRMEAEGIWDPVRDEWKV